MGFSALPPFPRVQTSPVFTDEVPLSVGHVARDVGVVHLQVQQPAVVGPGAELQLAPLDVKGEPADVHVARAHEDSWGDETRGRSEVHQNPDLKLQHHQHADERPPRR